MNQPEPMTATEVIERADALPRPGEIQFVETKLDESTVLLQVISRAAQDTTIDLDRMERLLVMHEKLNQHRAERQFIEAMTQFKRTAPTITKNKLVGYANRDGTTTGYKHATLAAVTSAAIASLADVGISHRWDLEQLEDRRVRVTCVLTHTGGHSTRTSLEGAPDDSGKKNLIQQTSSTITYLQRYTLLAATGLATEDDDDGAGGKAANGQHKEAPEGYENWRADMGAIDTQAELEKAWRGSSSILRGYAAAFDSTWWEETKRKVMGK